MCKKTEETDWVKKFEKILKDADDCVKMIIDSSEHDDIILKDGTRVTLVKISGYYLLRSKVEGKLFGLTTSLKNAEEDFWNIESNNE